MHTIPGQNVTCDFQNAPDARFCASCGQALQIVCLNCGTALPAGFSFCTTCGSPLADMQVSVVGADPAAPPVRDRPAPIAERRLVSVMFCDLVDFTGIAEALDPEEVRDLLSRYFEAARQIVSKYGGMIEKFIGDAVMAVWGTPIAREDDPVRAVRAALDLVHAVGEMRSPRSASLLRARGAVATGESAVMIGLEGQGMVAGDIVNTASRLQSVADAGTVLMNDAARDATAGVIVSRQGPVHRLKGKSVRVRSWRAVRPVPERERRTSEPPLVGRQRELDELLAAVAAVERSGRARLVSVVGIPGIGKSRLAQELRQRLEERTGTVLICRVPGEHDGSPFGPLAEVVRQELKIGAGESSEIERRKLHSALPEIVPDDAERAWLEPRLEVLLNPTEQPRAEREVLFGAWRRFLELLTARGTLVFILDDAHRADEALLDFIEQTVDLARDRPMAFITLARPELFEARPSWGAGLRSFTSIHLDKLGSPALKQVLAARAPDLPARTVSEVLRRADGVPLYAVELARLMGASRTRKRIAEATEVPGTLHGLIAARIDALPPAERSLLLSAAVLGGAFTSAEVAAVAEMDAATVRQGVEALVRQEILTRHQERHGSPAQLMFQEQLVQEIAYRTLARRDRRRRHLAAADFLEGLTDEDLVETIAGHLVNAYRADPDHPDAAAIAERARSTLRLAANRASALHAPERALAHLTDALSLASAASERATLTEEAAMAAQASGRFGESERLWRELIGMRRSLRDQQGVARGTARLASLLFLVHRNEAALDEVETALKRLGSASRDDPAMVELAGQLARAHFGRGEPAEAARWADQALDAAERLGLHPVATDALITRGTARLAMGDTTAGVEDLNRAIEQCSQGELLALELRARNNLAWLLLGDDPRRTLESARRGFEMANAKGMRDMALQLASVALSAAIDTGDWDWGLETIDHLDDEAMAPAQLIDLAANETIIRALRGEARPAQALAQLEPFSQDTNPQVVAEATYARAWVAFLAGRFGTARRLASESAAGSEAVNRNAALQLSARSALWSGDADAAASDLAALREASTTGRAFAASVRSIEAGVDALSGRKAKAAAEYRAAIKAWQSLDLPLQLALTLLERNAFLGSRNGEMLDQIQPALRARGLSRLARRSAAHRVSEPMSDQLSPAGGAD